MALISAVGSSSFAVTPSASRASALSGIDFSVRGIDAPALRDQLAVVIVPARSRQVEHPLALRPALRRIGVRVDEDVAMIEGGDQLRSDFDSSMPLPNTSPDMSPQPATLTSSDWTSMPISRKWRWTEIHAPRGGDPHHLVVVAVRPAARERVAEPEIAVERDRIGDVGESRGALVGGDDEIGIVAVMDDDSRPGGRPCR